MGPRIAIFDAIELFGGEGGRGGCQAYLPDMMLMVGDEVWQFKVARVL
jgi:hypothetical protein